MKLWKRRFLYEDEVKRAIRQVKKTWTNGIETDGNSISAAVAALNHAEGMLASLKTVEAEPVRHGEWIYAGGNMRSRYYRCSLCNAMYEGRSNFCPECGVKMCKKNDKEESTYDKLPPEVQKHIDEAVDCLLGKGE